MDVVTLGMAKSDTARRTRVGGSGLAYLGDSHMANGSTSGSNTGQYIGTVSTAVAAGATTLILAYPYTSGAGFANVTPPGTGVAYVLEEGTAREEWVVPSAVSGAGPYTLTVPALTYAHAAGVPARNDPRMFGSVSVPLWVSVLSGGDLPFRGLFAHGGYTTQQLHDIYLPQVLALPDKPWGCVVQVGTNDDWALGTIALVRTIMSRLIAAGVVPIMESGIPSGSTTPLASDVLKRLVWNAALAQLCLELGAIWVDVTAPLSDVSTGGMAATYASDNTHTAGPGARVRAQAIVTAVSAIAPRPIPPVLRTRNSLAGSTVLPFNGSNALLLTDTNTDGIPDNWTEDVVLAGVTKALVAEPGVAGNMFKATRPAASNGESRFSSSITLVAGHRYRAYMYIKTTGVTAAHDALANVAGGITSSSFAGFGVRFLISNTDTVFSINAWKLDMPLTLIEFEFVMPKRSDSLSASWTLVLPGTSSVPAYSVQFQPWLVDITALGI
jgi:hypothetical protein